MTINQILGAGAESALTSPEGLKIIWTEETQRLAMRAQSEARTRGYELWVAHVDPRTSIATLRMEPRRSIFDFEQRWAACGEAV